MSGYDPHRAREGLLQAYRMLALRAPGRSEAARLVAAVDRETTMAQIQAELARDAERLVAAMSFEQAVPIVAAWVRFATPAKHHEVATFLRGVFDEDVDLTALSPARAEELARGMFLFGAVLCRSGKHARGVATLDNAKACSRDAILLAAVDFELATALRDAAAGHSVAHGVALLERAKKAAEASVAAVPSDLHARLLLARLCEELALPAHGATVRRRTALVEQALDVLEATDPDQARILDSGARIGLPDGELARDLAASRASLARQRAALAALPWWARLLG